MKQFQFDFNSISSLKRNLEKINLWRKAKVYSCVFFQIYSDTLDRGQIDVVCEIISQSFPDAFYMGCSTNGNIIEGSLSSASISVVCSVLEYPTTKLKLLQYPLFEDTALDVVASLEKELNVNPWVKAVEMQMTIRGMSMTPFCEALSKLRPDVQIFGGGAFNPNLNSDEACVFSSVGGCTSKGVVFLLVGGDDFYVQVNHVTGWKPLGKEFLVTRAKGATLYELDGKPAYEAYYRYLNIANDENFFNNTLEFPFFYQHNGINILRAPIASNPDGSLTMTSDIDENVKARIAYGDPWTILHSIRTDGLKVREFRPEIIKIFSCAARRTYWGKAEISKETLPLQTIAPASGFYTSSEFMRNGIHVNQHNVTLVIAAMRESTGNEDASFDMDEERFSGKVSMINRLATFIDAATQELAEVNGMLSVMAVTDPLSNLFNRGEIQRRIIQCVSQKIPGCLVMLDIDNFKQINDEFGHQEGDEVIRGIADVMRKVSDESGLSGIMAHNSALSDINGLYASTGAENIDNGFSRNILKTQPPIGRWGGEEFMVLLENVPLEKAAEFAEKIRRAFNDIAFKLAGHRSVSVGVTKIKEGENADVACIRVDQALYKAKMNGKNRVVIL